jgi:SAM-dependent methyltransferase
MKPEPTDSVTPDADDFQDVTEMPGDPVSQVQIDRLYSRYSWAAGFCEGRDVVEAGCGAGPGLGLLSAVSRTLEAGDLSESILANAIRHYGDRIALSRFSADAMPFQDHSKDVVILFEALYYLPSASGFLLECKRVLRPGGRVLLVTANKDQWDFHPSAHSVEYHGVVELNELLQSHGFDAEFFGYERASESSMGNKMLRAAKRFAVTSGLMPKTMAGKRWLKRIVFGPPVPMPGELLTGGRDVPAPTPLDSRRPDTEHRIIYCAATLERQTIAMGGAQE